MTPLTKKLARLYNDQTKHSRYQNIPDFVRQALNYSETIDENWRGDSARYRYLLEELACMTGGIFGDIGANTGFFTFSLAHLMKEKVFYAYDMNKKHIQFMELIKDYFGMENIHIKLHGVDLYGIEKLPIHHVLIHFNVLHHGGVDFDQKYVMNEHIFSNYARLYLSKLRRFTSFMYFQMGYNWGGNKKKPIISVDNQEAMIRYQANLFMQCGWEIGKIALFNYTEKKYFNLPSSTLEAVCKHTADGLSEIIDSYRMNKASEFYKRPLLLVKNPDFKKQYIKP